MIDDTKNDLCNLLERTLPYLDKGLRHEVKVKIDLAREDRPVGHSAKLASALEEIYNITKKVLE